MTFAPEEIRSDTWPAIHALLKPALVRAGDHVTDLIDQLIDGTAQLWVLRKGGDPIAAAVSELVSTPLGLIVHGRLCAGKGMAGWLDDALECVRSHAREAGAIEITIEGRAGWEPLLAKRGWHRKAVVMALPLTPERVN